MYILSWKKFFFAFRSLNETSFISIYSYAVINPLSNCSPTMEAEYGFPGTPYGVQRQLMSAIYDTIEKGRVGLFESPTGTGKTLSIICATLTWLQKNRISTKSNQASAGVPIDTTNDDPWWVSEQTESHTKRDVQDKLYLLSQKYQRRVRNVSQRISSNMSRHVPTYLGGTNGGACDDMDELFAGIEDEGGGQRNDFKVGKESQKRKQRFEQTNTNGHATKVIFATRTHSQLAQFVSELEKTTFSPPSLAEAASKVSSGDSLWSEHGTILKSEIPFSVIVFGSRRQMCVNDEVRKLSSGIAIADRCRELVEGSESKKESGKRGRQTGRCVFHDEERENVLKEQLLIGSHDIEDVAKMGRTLGACPYFATRFALSEEHVDIIAAPYSVVLHDGTRDNIGLVVDEDTVVVFDEGHNVAHAMRDAYECSIDEESLNAAIGLLEKYRIRYFSRLSSQSLFRVRQLKSIVEGFAMILSKKKGCSETVMKNVQIIFEAGADNINLFDIVAFLRESRLSRKIRGLAEEEQDNPKQDLGIDNRIGDNHVISAADSERRRQRTVSKEAVSKVQRVIEAMCECGEYGRIAVYPCNQQREAIGGGNLRHFVVDCSRLFARAVGKARSILFLGGTLSPRHVLKDTLLKDLTSMREDNHIVEFECEHVVPAENVLSRVCTVAPNGIRLTFTYNERARREVLDGLGEMICNCVEKVNGGVVIFFASYELLRLTRQRWDTTTLLGKLHSIKPVVVEERGIDNAWSIYESAIQSDMRKGALLLAVLGGKLSEGVNFSDALGRLVVVVGMPFGNPKDVEMNARISAITNNLTDARKEMLESECMTVVNQAIGRAVRHKCDFAAVLLVDARYARSHTLNKLPAFIRRNVEVSSTCSQLQDNLKSFFLVHSSDQST